MLTVPDTREDSHHRVTLLDELVHVPTREGSLQEHHDILDHVLVCDVLHEGCQGLLCLSLEEVELHHLSSLYKMKHF